MSSPDWRATLSGIEREITIDAHVPSSLVIGRVEDGEKDPRVQYGVRDRLVSRVHARLTINALGEVWVEDMGSSNGTQLDGSRVVGRRQARCDAVLRVGVTDIRLRMI